MSDALDKIAAATALSRILEIQQYGLEEDYSHLASIKNVQDINLLAAKAIGIDLLKNKSKLEFDTIEKYDNFLNAVINNNLKNRYSESFLKDELELLEQARPFPVNTFRGFNLGRINSLVKSVYKGLGIPTHLIVGHVKSLYSVQVLDKEENNFLIASKIEWRSKEIIALFHVSISRSGELSNRPNSFDELAGQIVSGFQNISQRQPNIMSVFLFKSTNSRLNSPVRMFLQAISKYGQDITIGNVTKKFFLKGNSSKLLLNNGSKIVHHDKIFNGSKNGVMQILATPTGYQYSYVYTVSADSMVSNYKVHGFL